VGLVPHNTEPPERRLFFFREVCLQKHMRGDGMADTAARQTFVKRIYE